MNELFAADPRVCESERDLQLLLSKFGPFTGRYLSHYPINWTDQVEKQFEHLKPVEIARIKSLLQAAKKSLALIPSHGLSWRDERDWLENAASLLSRTTTMSAGFNGLITTHAKPPLIDSLDSLDLPPTSEEKIIGKADEYARVAERLLLLSPEIAFIDPYLKPFNRSCENVLKALFNIAAKGKSEKIIIWARASEVIGTKNQTIFENDLKKKLNDLTKNVSFKPKRKIEIILVDDEKQQDKMHARHILSIHGGIRLDHGFQELSGRHVEVGPVGGATHNSLYKTYFEGDHDMRIRLRFEQPC